MRPWSSAWILLRSVTQKDTWEIGWRIEPYTLCRYATDGSKGWIVYSLWVDLSLLGCYTVLCEKYFLTFQVVEIHLHSKEVHSEFSLTLRMRAPQSFETSEIIYQEKWPHIPEDFHLQKYRCDNVEYWIVFVIELLLQAAIRILRIVLLNAQPRSGCLLYELARIDRFIGRLCCQWALLTCLAIYRYAPHNDVSVNDAPLIRRWSHKIIIL